MFKETKEILYMEVKEGMMTISHQIDNIAKEIDITRKNILKLKNIRTEMENLLARLNSRCELTKERISKLEDRLVENVQSEIEREERFKKNEQSFREKRDTVKCTNISIRGLSEGRKRTEHKKYLKK